MCTSCTPQSVPTTQIFVSSRGAMLQKEMLIAQKQSFFPQWKFVYDEQYPKWFKVMNFPSGHFLAAFFTNGLMINGMHQNLNNKLSFDSKITMEKLKNHNFYLN